MLCEIKRGKLMQMTFEEHKSLVAAYIAAYNNFDVEAMLSLMDSGVVFKNVTGGEVNAATTGIDELRKLANQARALFSSRCQTITAFESCGDLATVEIDFEGVLAVDLPNGKKAGDLVRIKGRSEFEFKNGKLHKITDHS